MAIPQILRSHLLAWIGVLTVALLAGCASPQQGYYPAPVYPQEAMKNRWQGKVVIRIEVGEDGRPIAVGVSESSGYPILDQSAVAAVKTWRFPPGRARSLTYPLEFRAP